MTTQPTKDPVTLDALKKAIEAVAPRPPKHSPSDYWINYHENMSEAWRTAFEWHLGLIKRHAALSEKVGAHLYDWIAIDREEEDGIALIREKLS